MRTITEEQYIAIKDMIFQINRHMINEWDDYPFYNSSFFKWDKPQKKIIKSTLNNEDWAKKEETNEQ